MLKQFPSPPAAGQPLLTRFSPEAFNKNVTFSTANTAIATVNENGVVVGVAEGTTTVTVTSVADPTVSGSATVTVTESLPTVNL